MANFTKSKSMSVDFSSEELKTSPPTSPLRPAGHSRTFSEGIPRAPHRRAPAIPENSITLEFIPPGYEKRTCFVNTETGEIWLSERDQNGQTFYCREGGIDKE